MTGNKIKKNKKTTTLLEQLQTIIEKWNKQTKSVSSTRIIQTNKQTNKQIVYCQSRRPQRSCIINTNLDTMIRLIYMISILIIIYMYTSYDHSLPCLGTDYVQSGKFNKKWLGSPANSMGPNMPSK